MPNEQIKVTHLDINAIHQEMCSWGTESCVLGVYDVVAGAEAVQKYRKSQEDKAEKDPCGPGSMCKGLGRQEAQRA